MSYRNYFQNNRPVTINSMFNECSAVHFHSNALQVIRVRGADSNYLFLLVELVMRYSTVFIHCMRKPSATFIAVILTLEVPYMRMLTSPPVSSPCRFS